MLAGSTAPWASSPSEASSCHPLARAPACDVTGSARQPGRPDSRLDGPGGRQAGRHLGCLWGLCGRDRAVFRDECADRASDVQDVVRRSAPGDRCRRAISCVDLGCRLAWGHRERRPRAPAPARRVGHRLRAVQNAAMDGASHRDVPAQGVDFLRVSLAATDPCVGGRT